MKMDFQASKDHYADEFNLQLGNQIMLTLIKVGKRHESPPSRRWNTERRISND